jgi:hypothetical protein
MGPAAFLPALVLAAAAHGGGDTVERFRCGGEYRVGNVDVRDVNDTYAWRSVDIIRASLANDRVRLARMVAPTAEFTIYVGDVGTGPRSKGVDAAVGFGKQVSPTRFEFSGSSAGPFVMDPCGKVTAELTLMADRADEATIISFEYDKGVLVSASGRTAEIVRGQFTSADSQ